MSQKDTWTIDLKGGGQWQWIRQAYNGELAAASKLFATKAECEHNARLYGLGDIWEVYQDRNHEWRWHRKAANGTTVGASSEGYSSRAACVLNARRHGYGE